MDKQVFKEIVWMLIRVIPVITVVSSVIMYSVFTFLVPDVEPDFITTFLSSIIYTSIFCIVLIPAFYILDYQFPLNHAKWVVLHIIIQFGLTLVCYFTAFALTDYLFNYELEVETSNKVISFLLSLLITFTIIGWFYIRLFIARNEEAKTKMMEAELSALKAQVNPHFLFNSLNSIAALTRINPKESEMVTEDLAELFRYSLNASKKEHVTLAEELESCTMYLNIEMARFRNRLNVSIEVSESLKKALIPPLILQPLVENAIKHGLQKQEGNFHISIKAEEINQWLVIEDTDTGPGMNPSDKDIYLKKGTGLSNVHSRLQLYAGKRASLTIKPNGVNLTLPLFLKETSESII